MQKSTLTENPLISVILPVYNRHQYLGQAIESVLNQNYRNWELIIADDASESETQAFLKKYVCEPHIKVLTNPRNIGLFANLNYAITMCKGQYIILLCSDDLLLSNCLSKISHIAAAYPEAYLILSPFQSVDSEGKDLSSGSLYYYDQFAPQPVQLLQSSEVLPLLLKYGSINGNLTGMFFKRELFDSIGGFRENWRHAADWEWLYRACSTSKIIISKTPVATIRYHPEQLSGVNFKNLSNSLEVIEMVRLLLNDPRICKLDSAPRWALHIMQFHLWFAVKFALQGRWSDALTITKAISQVTSLVHTLWAMLRWLPQRWQVYQQKNFPLPPA
jgi:glycosyltransferase involved in cell wall biosynthesis